MNYLTTINPWLDTPLSLSFLKNGLINNWLKVVEGKTVFTKMFINEGNDLKIYICEILTNVITF